MTGIDKETLKFLSDLQKNNDRDWFNENKARFEEAKAAFAAFMDQLIAGVARFDPAIAGLEAKNCIFRIYRDIRFSKDKTPYNPRFGGHLLAGGRQQERGRAGYYIHIMPENCFLAGGAHQPPGPWVNAIRDRIARDSRPFRKIINAKSFKSCFGDLEGETLKTAPRGYDKDHPDMDLLRQKSFLAVHRMKDADVLKDGFLDHAVKVFRVMHPFGRFLNGE